MLNGKYGNVSVELGLENLVSIKRKMGNFMEALNKKRGGCPTLDGQPPHDMCSIVITRLPLLPSLLLAPSFSAGFRYLL